MGGARAQPIRKEVKLRRQPKPGKLKSHKGALKRFYQTGDGTFMHKAAGKRHMMCGASRRRQTRSMIAHRAVTAKGIIRKLKRLMPYGTTMRPPRRHVEKVVWERPEGWAEAVQAAVEEALAKAKATASGGATKKAKKKAS